MPLKRSLVEFARCTKHNLLHLKRFDMSFHNGNWLIRHARGAIVVTTYPYLACHDMEGYLKNGEWDLSPGETVVDAGGCYGEFTLYASQCVGPTGRVLMLEPDETNLRIARRNFELNGNPTNITIIPAGLWNERGSIRFATGHEAVSTMVGRALIDAQDDAVEVPTLTLADLVRDQRLGRLDFVKIDIEGAELEALSVVDRLPADMKPRYAIASYHPRDGEKTAGRCETMLKALGYTVATGNPRHQTTWAWQ
ncbi:MAG TPA: FkbM family methyltransferase [Tepidisphaeraceae bacterium]